MRRTDVWPILRIVSLLLHIPAAAAALSVLVAAALDEWTAAAAFGAVAALGAVIAQSCGRFFPRGHEPAVREAVVGSAVAWLLSAVLGALPFVIVAHAAGDAATPSLRVFTGFATALFEGMSGFTSAGLTMVDRPSEMPMALIWWRSLMQWIGGAGIVILALAVISSSSVGTKLYRAEAHDQTLGGDVRSTVRAIWLIYLGFTVFAVVLFWALGMTAWHALNYGLAAVATGGFVSSDGNVADFGAGVRIAVMLVTLLAAISFISHARVFRGDWRGFAADLQARWLIVLAVLVAVSVFLALRGGDTRPAALDVAFQAVSALATAGFQTADVAGWGEAAMLVLVIAMMFGGSAGSTVGGIKIDRVLTLGRTLAGYLVRIAREPHLFIYRPGALPREVHPELTGHIATAMLLLVLWILTVVIGAFVLTAWTADGIPFLNVLFEAASAVSTVGLTAGVAGPDLAWPAKLVFVALMWMGRLEIVPILVLVTWIALPGPHPREPRDEDVAGKGKRRSSGSASGKRGGKSGRRAKARKHKKT